MKILMGDPLIYEGVITVGSHHYANLFLEHQHDVFWLGGALHPLNLLRAALGNPHHRELAQLWRRGVQTVRPRLMTYHPLTLLPYRKFPLLDTLWVLRHSLDFSVPSVRRVLAQHGFEQPDALWLTHSHYGLSLLAQVRYGKLLYRIADRFTEFAGVPKSMDAGDDEIIARADTVFVTARQLYDEVRQKGGDKVVYLPNGVNFPHFHIANPVEPADIAAIPRPRILYVGMIAEWFDTELLLRAAAALPTYSFILVGPSRIPLDALKAAPNIHVMGGRPFAAMPHYMHACDVGIMPFKKTALTQTISPIKIFEYLASGLATVSVRLHELESLASPTLLTDTADDFIDAIRQAVQGGRGHKAFIDFAEANSWEQRYRLIASRL
ncbi:MAG: glycosyltransferase [Chloroflexi bacterium]|nr:glycosyltransferase [Chloroflexota bacterium]